jgi:aryl-alcohol dehydrogenase-like predicted oxidoreductase
MGDGRRPEVLARAGDQELPQAWPRADRALATASHKPESAARGQFAAVKALLDDGSTSRVKHLEENVAAANIKLTAEEYVALDREGRAEYAAA